MTKKVEILYYVDEGDEKDTWFIDLLIKRGIKRDNHYR